MINYDFLQDLKYFNDKIYSLMEKENWSDEDRVLFEKTKNNIIFLLDSVHTYNISNIKSSSK